MNGTAVLSADEKMRFWVTREWHPSRPMLLVAMINPSRADAKVNDPTVSLVTQIADHHKFGSLGIVNLCPLRSSTVQPAIEMMNIAQIASPETDEKYTIRQVMYENLEHVERGIQQSSAILLAWGANGGRAGCWYTEFFNTVREHAGDRPIYRLGACANGHPMHPLARGKHKIAKTAPLLPWDIK